MSTYLADAAENASVAGPSAVFTYRRLGRQGGFPLVLLNRFRGTIDWWDPEFLDCLAAEHDVIVFDNVGIGYSSGEPRDSIVGFAEGPSSSSTRSACRRSTYWVGRSVASWRRRSPVADPNSCASLLWRAALPAARFRVRRDSARTSLTS